MPTNASKKEEESAEAAAEAALAEESEAAEEAAPEAEASGNGKCSCKKNQCLKLYCHCLNRGDYCTDDCVCADCHNTTDHDGEGQLRLESIRFILARKPDALTDELRAMAYAGGWTPPVKPPLVHPSNKRGRKKSSSKKVPAKAGKTVAKRGRGRPRKDDTEVDVDVGLKNEEPTAKEESEEEPAFSIEEYPQLALDVDNDHSDLATAFKRPLFPHPSKALEIAYNEHARTNLQRARAQKKKNSVLNEYNKLKEKYMQKKLELSLADDAVKGASRKVGMWTRKVFDLELEEECEWNANYRRLREYKVRHGKLPPTVAKAATDEERELATWLVRVRGQTADEKWDDDEDAAGKKPAGRGGKARLKDFPHRMERLAELGIVWETRTVNKWDEMFQKLLAYKEEMGTLRFPSDEQCALAGDPELIALQKWVKSQVLNYRYGKKMNQDNVDKLLAIGFDFEKWYAKPGKGRKSGKRKSPPEEMVEEADDRKMPAKEEVAGDIHMEV